MFFSLLPATVLAIYFFWVKLPLAALCCMVFLVFVVERLIHTYYVFTDEGCLFIHQGRFSKVSRHSLSDIEKQSHLSGCLFPDAGGRTYWTYRRQR